jgi:hypothetical protein
MPVLTLDYRCCDRKRPRYLKHAEVEVVATQARQQLVTAQADAIPLATLKQLDGLRINGLAFELWVDTEHPVTDEQGHPVLGLCEFDPDAGADAAVLAVSPVGTEAGEALVLSTFAHELGHAIFDAPGWIAAAAQGPGLFDDVEPMAHKAYRTTTRDAEHLGQLATAMEAQIPDEVRFAEYRANEFMGSLLVPKQHLRRAIEELAGAHGVRVQHSPSLDPALPGASLRLMDDGQADVMDGLQRALAQRFGVHRRFVEVRLERYGFLRPSAPSAEARR